MLDHRGERTDRDLSAGLVTGRAGDGVGDRDAVLRGAPHRHDPRDVANAVAPRAAPRAMRSRKAVPALPRPKALSRDARQLREHRRAHSLPGPVHRVPPARSLRILDCPCLTTLSVSLAAKASIQ